MEKEFDFENIVLGADGDSITAGEQWTKYVCGILGIKRCENVAVGSAVWYRRSAEADGAVISTQDFGSNGFAGISDGWLETQDKEEIQKRLNNCAVVHIEKYLSMTESGEAEKPDIFIFAMGTNDLEEHRGSISDTEKGKENQFTTAGAMAWCLRKIKESFPKCAIYVSLPIQTADESLDAKNVSCFPLMREIAAMYGAEVIDSYHGSGIIRERETPGAEGECLIDGLHPKENGREMMGRYIASSLR